MIGRIFETPRPMPRPYVPLLAGAAVVVLALPVVALAGWPIEGWALGAALWAGSRVLGLFLARLRLGAGNLAASGVVGIGMTFRAVAVMIVIIAVAASDATVAVAAALVYALAFTLELAVSLALYFGSPARG